MMEKARHDPVMLAEVLEVLAPRDGGRYVDGTFGAGGYTRGILEAADCTVLAIDRDKSALTAGGALAQRFPGRLTLIHGRFGDMDALLADHGVDFVDGIALDLGVSSMQVDEGARGFSFQADGPLDMRMGGAAEEGTESAADIINRLPEQDLARIIAVYGEEKRARAIARAIVRARATAPITSTGELAGLVSRVMGPRAAAGRIHPATRTFQALRIHVNDELGELARALFAAERRLKPTGRLAVVSFHSLEDRIVKRFLASRSGDVPRPSRHAPDSAEVPPPSFRVLFRGTRAPSRQEMARNPRARSAKLRAAERTAHPAHLPDLPALGVMGEIRS
jgi:16S rRNA (cytosine1402-N4)-methyltransferase